MPGSKSELTARAEKWRYSLLLAGVLLSAIAAVAAHGAWSKITGELHALRANRDYETTANMLLSALVDTETAYLGFLVAGETAFLTPFEEAKTSYAEARALLATLLDTADRKRREGRALLDASAAGFARLEAAIAAARSGADPDARTAAMRAVKSDLDRAREIHREALAGARKELADIRASAQESLTRLLITILLVAAGVIIITFVQTRDFAALAAQALRARASAHGQIEHLASELDHSRRLSSSFENRLRLTLVSAHVKLLAITATGELVWASEAAIGLLGERTLPVNLKDVARVADGPAIDAGLARAFSEKLAARMEISTRGSAGRKCFLVTISPSDVHQEGALLAVAIDIT